MFKRPALAFAFFALSIAPCLAKGPIQPLRVGNWQGGSYTYDNTGKFSHCAAGVPYGRDIYVIVTVERDYSWDISLLRPEWHFQIGRQIPVSISFDNVGPFNLSARTADSNFIVITMPNSDAAIQAFRAAIAMRIVIEGQLYNFNLLSSSDLLPALSNCVAQNLQPPSVATTPPTTPATPATQAEPKLNPEVEATRNKLLTDAANDYSNCIQSQMKQLVPLSNEGAETLAQVIITKCGDIEQRYVELSMAMYGVSRAQVEDAIHGPIEARKKNIVADIVTFRAELAKALLSQPKRDDASDEKKGQGL